MTNAFNLALLHGGGQGSWVWTDTIAALRLQAGVASGRICALDVPGCGVKRGRATQAMVPLDVARELIADLESAGMRDIVLVGHSLAGNVLPSMVELRPDLFRHLIYVSCSVPLPGQTVLQMLGKGTQGSNENEVGWPVDPATTPMNQRYDAMYCNDMTDAQRERFLENLGLDEWPHSFFSNTAFEFKQLDAIPATYVVCLEDRILPVRWQEKFAARFHAKQLVRIDAGHQVMISRPHALAEVLRHVATAAG